MFRKTSIKGLNPKLLRSDLKKISTFNVISKARTSKAPFTRSEKISYVKRFFVSVLYAGYFLLFAENFA